MNPYFSASAFFAGISRRAFLWRGILVGLLGLLVALNPLITLELLSILLGWVFAAVGVWAILSDFTFHSHSPFLHTFSPSHPLTFSPLPHLYSYLPQVLVSRRIAYHQYVFARNDAHGVRLLIPKLERAARQSYAYVG